MNARDVVKAAALIAARHAWPDIHESLVRWSDESRSQGESDSPHVTLSTISHVPEGPVIKDRKYDRSGSSFQMTLLQPFIWTVQVKCEGWRLDSAEDNNPVLFAHRMRFGWYLQAVTAALLDTGSPENERTPVKMVDEVGQVITLNQRVRGHTLPVLAYEMELRYVTRSEDPAAIDIIETVSLGGRLEGGGGPGSGSPPGSPGVDIRIRSEPASASAAGCESYVESFSAAPTWTVNHNFGRHPYTWAIESLGALEIDVAVQHISLNTSRVLFDTPTPGVVRFT